MAKTHWGYGAELAKSCWGIGQGYPKPSGGMRAELAKTQGGCKGGRVDKNPVGVGDSQVYPKPSRCKDFPDLAKTQ